MITGKKSPAELAALTVRRIQLKEEQKCRLAQVKELSGYIQFVHLGVLDGEAVNERLNVLKQEEEVAKAELEAIDKEFADMAEEALEGMFGNIFGSIFDIFKNANKEDADKEDADKETVSK